MPRLNEDGIYEKTERELDYAHDAWVGQIGSDGCCCEYEEPGDEYPSTPCSGCSSHVDYDTRPTCAKHEAEAWGR